MAVPKLMENTDCPSLPYDPAEFPRETQRHYITASEEEIRSMLETIGCNSTQDLFSHIDDEVLFAAKPDLPDELEYGEAVTELFEISDKTNLKNSFVGDMLPVWSTHPIVDFVSKLRPLTTSYTPYQPERSQGTLVTHWIYQCALSALTGFEAINTSLYDRSSALFEAIACAIRTSGRGSRVLLAEGLFDEDVEVLETLAKETEIQFSFAKICPSSGVLDHSSLQAIQEDETKEYAAFVFPQVNKFGLLENVDSLTDYARERGMRSIASIDPMLLATGGLKPPSDFGAEGADFIAGEAQHLAIPPSFGGPGLGLFGSRFNEKQKRDLRSTPGRYVGKAKDVNGRDCFVMVLSTREQHIRKEKATSNICSNQAFLATLAGASLLAKGEHGLEKSLQTALDSKDRVLSEILTFEGVRNAFPQSPSFNEVTLELDCPVSSLIEKGRDADLHVGVDVSQRSCAGKERNLLKLTFCDLLDEEALDSLIRFFNMEFPRLKDSGESSPPRDSNPKLFRKEPADLPSFSFDELAHYYEQLADLNVSPDDGCYPLGSCTMKYNPMLNDWAADLPGFSRVHPQAPEEDSQGPLSVLYETQEWFKKITGLAAVTTQPVAGAQGELVGLKLFQAYHRKRGEDQRNVVFIPKSAHGTNFATAAMAGYPDGIVYLRANDAGTIDMEDFTEKINSYGDRLCGVMITNPNTSGIFENRFHEIADAVHEAGGLVYMDGANMNAIAGIVNLAALGVDAVHNNLHKTWTIPHGGGGPGDAIVAVSEKLVEFLPGKQIYKDDKGIFRSRKPKFSIGSFHRHWGNFGHKVRAYSYLLRLGKEGVPRMSSTAVLSSRYLFAKLGKSFPTLPACDGRSPRMHEFILTLCDEDFEKLEKAGIPKAKAIPQVGKLFLDFGFHAPTVAFPEIFGLMIEPTESYGKKELDRFADAVLAIKEIIESYPQAIKTAPHFTPIDRVDEVSANRNLCLRERLDHLPPLPFNRIKPSILKDLSIPEIKTRILEAARSAG
jgi:glycine dehydrogenase